jgi:hypothetical protein
MLINKSIKNSYDHVFFISNQISLIIAKLIIDNYKIDKKKIKIFLFRDIDSSIIGIEPIMPKKRKIDSKLDKILWDSMMGRRIIKHLKKDNNKFLLYAEWANRETEKVLKYSNCIGHNYIETGQHSYMNIPLFSPKKLSFKNKFNKNWKNRLSDIDEKAHFFFRDDAAYFIGINNDVFPYSPKDRKIVLKNFKSLKSVYTPKLKGIKNIGLTCALRRIEHNGFDEMLNKLTLNLPNNSAVKAHPSLMTDPEIFSQFKEAFLRITKNKFKLCDNNIILELEMLHDKKNLIGPQTSLSRYAEMLGSKFNYINLY